MSSAKPTFQILAGLPVYGPMATPFPPEWGRLGREGVVVQFNYPTGESWTANVRRGLGGIVDVRWHPDEHHILVAADGDMWVVDHHYRTAGLFLTCVFQLWEVTNPKGFVVDIQGIEFARIGPAGIVWRSERLSWDGFKEVRLDGDDIVGLGWSLDDVWLPFRVNVRTGEAQGGGYRQLPLD